MLQLLLLLTLALWSGSVSAQPSPALQGALELPFKSSVRTELNGQSVGVMHACGHDTHVAMLLGVAQALAQLRADIPGTLKFIFQPAEEGAPAGEEGGASLMIKQGVLADPVPGAIFGLHVWPLPVGTIAYRPGPTMASSDRLTLTIQGKHRSSSWTRAPYRSACARCPTWPWIGLQLTAARCAVSRPCNTPGSPQGSRSSKGTRLRRDDLA